MIQDTAREFPIDVANNKEPISELFVVDLEALVRSGRRTSPGLRLGDEYDVAHFKKVMDLGGSGLSPTWIIRCHRSVADAQSVLTPLLKNYFITYGSVRGFIDVDVAYVGKSARTVREQLGSPIGDFHGHVAVYCEEFWRDPGYYADYDDLGPFLRRHVGLKISGKVLPDQIEDAIAGTEVSELTPSKLAVVRSSTAFPYVAATGFDVELID